MAIFFHGNRSMAYQSHFAPFTHDLLLLQSSRFNPEFWNPVLENLNSDPKAGGRIITVEWSDTKLETSALATDLKNLIRTLGLHSLHVVACDDAVKVVNELEKTFPGVIGKTLLYPINLPRTEDLVRAVSEFVKD